LIHNKKADREDQGERYTNLFVQNLPTGMNDGQLKDLFKEYGDIDSAQMNAKNNRTGFVSFKNHNEAKAAKEGMDAKLKTAKDTDCTILVAPHISRKENDLQPKSSKPIVRNQKETFKSNIFVRYIPKDVTEEVLREKFKAAGQIASVKLKDHAQRINGETFSNYQLGFVLYADVESAQRCIKMFDASNCFGYSSKALKVDFWQAKDDLKQEAEEKSAAGLK
jgi:RNA recognition motif-containing protein